MTSTSSRQPSSSSTDRRRLPLAVAAACAFSLIVGAGAALAQDAAVDAAKLWTKNCQSCHGPDGKGKTKAGEKSGAKDLSSPEIKAKLDRAKAIDAIKNGVKEKDSEKLAMKAYSDKLSEAEINALADHSLAFK